MNFERLKELKEICEKHYASENCYFSSLEGEELGDNPPDCSWEKDLRKLSPEIWSLFRDDLCPALFSKEHIWTQLIKKINKAKGYAYLHEKIKCDQISFTPRFHKDELEFPCWIGKKDQLVYPCEVVTISFSDRDIQELKPIIDKAKTRLINYQSDNVGENILFVIIKKLNHKDTPEELKYWYEVIKSHIVYLIKDHNITLELGYLDRDNNLLPC